jgi:hypothetical protein
MRLIVLALFGYFNCPLSSHSLQMESVSLHSVFMSCKMKFSRQYLSLNETVQTTTAAFQGYDSNSKRCYGQRESYMMLEL